MPHRRFAILSSGAASALVMLSLLASAAPQTAASALSPQSIVDAVTSRLAGIPGYHADLAVQIKMRSFPFLRVTLRGSATYRRPGGFTVALPQRRVARSYEAALNDMVDPTSWRKNYTVTIDASKPLSPELVALRFFPKKAGSVDHTTAIVDRDDKTIRQIDWFYADGGHARVVQSFVPVDGLLLLSHQTIDVAMRQANVLADADLGNYSILSPPVAFKQRAR